MPEDLAFSEATENTHQVPKRSWRKWNNQARYIFNQVYAQMGYQPAMKHPKAELMHPDHWNTLRWNSAWVAADAAMATLKAA
jgi:hypothetical protein